MDDMEVARRLLDEWLGGFRFADAAGYALAIGAALTPIVRELVDGPTPLIAVDAPTPGSGKGLLVGTIGIISGGGSTPIMSDASDEAEMRKRVTSTLMDGPSVVVIDNIKRKLESGTLAAVLTSREWRDRKLGFSENVVLPNRALWMATGNNITVDSEIARRTVWLRIDPRVDRPWERDHFRRADLAAWVREHRHELLWALLVLVRQWMAVGRPPWDGKPLGSFESWTRVVGGVLMVAGIDGFLSNREALYQTVDAETQVWRAFVNNWWDRFSDHPTKAAALLDLAVDCEMLGALVPGAVNAPPPAQLIRLGKAVAARRDRLYGRVAIRVVGQDGHSKGTLYRLELLGPAEGDGLERELSANPPHENRASSGSNAEDAESADSFSNLGDDTPREGHTTSACAEPGSENPPHPPHSPQPDSKPPASDAEGSCRANVDSPHPPPGTGGRRCRQCLAPMSVVAIDDICGRCKQWPQQPNLF
jgi:hypothetical protein